MSNFVDDDLDLPNSPKVDAVAPPVGVPATEQFAAADHQAIRQALLDIKNQHVGPSATNADGVIIPPGAPCRYSGATSIARAKADAAANAEVDGLALAQLAIAGAGKLRVAGIHTLATALWDAVTGQTGGLTPNTVYYLDPSNAGKLTTTAPTTAGQQVVRIGRAINSTQMRLLIQPPIGL